VFWRAEVAGWGIRTHGIPAQEEIQYSEFVPFKKVKFW
jgi:hypothetical protein